MKEFKDLLGEAKDKAGEGLTRVVTYAQQLRDNITRPYRSGERVFNKRRAISYPLICVATGGLGAEVVIELTNLLAFSPLVAASALRGEVQTIPDLILNNPLRQMFVPTIPLFTGGAGILVGAAKVVAEEYLGLKADYKALFEGRK